MEFTFEFHQQDNKVWIGTILEIPDLIVVAPTMEVAEQKIRNALNTAINVIGDKLKENTMVWDWDIFISHASEDKQEIVQPIVDRLKALGVRVWYDSFEIKLGESWVQKISEGLAKSKYGLFIVSPNFPNKDWTNREYETFTSLVHKSQNRILPIRHKLSFEELNTHFPLLAPIQHISTDEGLDIVIRKIMERVDPQNSYFTDGVRGLVIKPSSIRIHHSEWHIVSNNTIYIQNTTHEPVYAVMLKIILKSKDLTFDDIQINGLGNFVLGMADGSRQSQISSIPPLGFREISITTSKATTDSESTLLFEITSFDSKPSPMLGKKST